MSAALDSPLFEGDHDSAAIIEPSRVLRVHEDMPERVVLCFFNDVVGALAQRHDARAVAELHSETGDTPIWRLEVDGVPVAVVHPGVGAPMAVVTLEEVVAMGAKRVIACGGAGALLPDLVLGHAVVVDSAVRDEGTSHHYLAPGRVIDADPAPVARLRGVLDGDGVAHLVGRSWTTDAVYRETRARTDRRIAERCVVVEMEAAALIAVARYRDVPFGQVLMAGDSLAGEQWDHRGWTTAAAAREEIFWVAARAAAGL